MLDFSKHSLETAAAYQVSKAMDLEKERYGHRAMQHTVSEIANDSSAGTALANVGDWLPFAAEKYKISAKLENYVVVPTIMVTSDLPNRNLAAFPLSTLTEFNTYTGDLAYRSWNGKCTFIEHNNDDVEQAKGVIFDVSLSRVTKSDGLWKVVGLLGFDKTKDRLLANAILTGQRNAYSMGCYVDIYECTICGYERAGTDKSNGCGHVHPNRAKFNTYEISGKKVLAGWNVKGFHGFECSSVADPAFKGAESNTILNG
jgi:hypothetical protein